MNYDPYIPQDMLDTLPAHYKVAVFVEDDGVYVHILVFAVGNIPDYPIASFIGVGFTGNQAFHAAKERMQRHGKNLP